MTCQLECCHLNLNASFGREQVNQGKSALICRSGVLGLIAGFGGWGDGEGVSNWT